MLLKQDWKKLLWSYHLMIWIGFIPWSIDRKTGEVQVTPKTWFRWIWKIGFYLEVAVATFVYVRMVLMAIGVAEVTSVFIACHIAGLATYGLGVCVGYDLFIKYPEFNTAIFNDLCRRSRAASLRRTKRSYTWNEYLVLSLPWFYLCVNGSQITWHLIESGTDATVFIYSSFPTEWRSPTMEWIVGVVQLYPTLATLGMLVHFNVMTILFFQRCIETIDEREQSIRSMDVTDKKILTEALEIRMIQLEIKMYNMAMSRTCFSKKVLDLSTATTNIFFALRYFHKYLMPAITWLYVGVFETIIYCFNFDKAFMIPSKMSEFVHQLDRVSLRLKNESDRQYLRKFLKSVPRVGIKCGPFNYFERESTLNFLAFVFDKTAGLIISYPPLT